MEKLRENKVLGIIGTILYYFLVVLIFAVLVVVILQRVSNNNLTIGGIRIFNVVTESMVPKYEVGDVLIAKTVDADSLQVGDDVAYRGEVGTFNGKIVTHQIIEKKTEDGQIKFVTKGIANEESDPQISSNQVYGKIIYKVKSLSIISKIINNLFGFYFLIFVPITILIIIKIRDIYLDIKERKEDDKDGDEDDKEEGSRTDKKQGNSSGTKSKSTKGNKDEDENAKDEK